MEQHGIPRYKTTGKADMIAVAAIIMREISDLLWMNGKKFRITIECDPETNSFTIIRHDFKESE